MLRGIRSNPLSKLVLALPLITLIMGLGAAIPPPQGSLDIPPIPDPTRTGVLSGFVPLAKSEPGKGPALRSVVWVLKPASVRTPKLPDQPVIVSGAGFSPNTVALTPGTRVQFRTNDRGVRIVRGTGLQRFERRLTRDTNVVPVVPDRDGAITLAVDGTDSGGLVVCADSPYLSVAGEDGSFRIVGLPPGRRDVRVRMADGKVKEFAVELKAGTETSVDWRERTPPAATSPVR